MNIFQGSDGYISALYHCPTDETTDLCFYDIAEKLKHNGTYDIGGTYTEDEPEFWFYYTTTLCHGNNYLLNLFALPRKPSNFSISLPKSIKLSSPIKNNDENTIIAFGPRAEFTFRTTQKDENIFITTLRFDSDEISALESSTLLVPFSIELHNKLQLDQNIVRTIKLRHNLSNLVSQSESKDLTLISITGKEYPVHKVLLAAHSPVLRLKLVNVDRTLPMDVSDDAMEVILEFLYTGTLSNLYKQDFMMLLGIAEGLQFAQLFALAQQLLGEQINVENAVNVAVIAKKYNLNKLTMKVFDFIKLNPEVMATELWHTLEDIDLVKQLLKYIHPSSHNID